MRFMRIMYELLYLQIIKHQYSVWKKILAKKYKYEKKW